MVVEGSGRMCLLPDGYLFREFGELFNDVLSDKAPIKRAILEALAEGPMGGSELAARIKVERNGHFSEVLNELEIAGFLAKADGINPASVQDIGHNSHVGCHDELPFLFVCPCLTEAGTRPLQNRCFACRASDSARPLP